ncbi:hypothetical protein SUGI_0588490 [Cryptomeria japonica]|nr:hypothetical protein SUGI_0588490 [Cryptomeria japonica]
MVLLPWYFNHSKRLNRRDFVGCFVLNDQNQVLVVLENYGPFRGTGVLKIPTGVINEGEDIFTGAIREIKEETLVNDIRLKLMVDFKNRCNQMIFMISEAKLVLLNSSGVKSFKLCLTFVSPWRYRVDTQFIELVGFG